MDMKHEYHEGPTPSKSFELVALGVREIYVFYADGVGESRLKIPCAKAGTGRNMNTVARLAAMAGAL